MKRWKIYSLVLFSLICVALPFYAQRSKIDSLLLVLKLEKTDTNKINILIDLAWEFRTIDADSSIAVGSEAMQICEKLKTISNHNKSIDKKIASISIILGACNRIKNNYSQALVHYSEALNIYKKNGDKSGIASTLGNMGIAYVCLDDYSNALRNTFEALRMNEELNSKSSIASNLSNIALIYKQQEEYIKALKYYNKALKLIQELGDKREIARINSNIGIVYKNLKNYPKALEYHFEALKTNQQLEYLTGIAYCLSNIGITFEEQGNNLKALEYFEKGLEISEEKGIKHVSGGIKGHIGSIYIKTADQLSSVKMKQKKYKEAERYLLDALVIDSVIGSLDGEEFVHSSLSEMYSKTGQYQKALMHYKKQIALRDTLFNEENRKNNIRVEMNFEFEKKEAIAKEAAIATANIAAAESKKQKIIIWSVVCGLLLVILFSGFLLNRYNVIRQQKKIIESQKLLVEEKHKEITDSINYAERIQKSFLATKDLLDRNFREYFVFFQPKDIVSGDFYWASKLHNGNFSLVTADSTGHGVPGAIMSLLNITSLELALKDGIILPAEILNHTRKSIIDRLKKDGSAEGGKDGMDCSLISFDFTNNKITYSAANNPIWIVRENKLLELEPDKMPVGKHDKDNTPFTQHEVPVLQGDVIYSITDGMPDQFGGPKGKKFMYKKLKELLVSISLFSMEEQKIALLNALNEWKGELEQVDDVTIIGVRI